MDHLGTENEAGARAPDDWVLLDVRNPDEFAAGHLHRALNIPLAELAARLTELGERQRSVAVYCRSGRRSASAAALLRRAGFSAVTDLGGQAP